VKRIKKILLIILIQALFVMCVNAQDYSDFNVKAIFIEKFTNYIKWPESYMSNDISEPVNIYIYGESNFYDILKSTYENKEIFGKPVLVSQIYKIENLHDCHILFIPECGSRKLQEILKNTANKPILTIADTENYAARGVLINFVLKENKIQFEINKSAVKDSGLEFDFRLIKIATII
jgi:YfiR/HmsC-like